MAESTTPSSANTAAQVNDDLNQLQQAPQTIDEAAGSSSTGTTVEAQNVPQQDNPSLLDSTLGTNNNVRENDAARQDVNVNITSETIDGVDGKGATYYETSLGIATVDTTVKSADEMAQKTGLDQNTAGAGQGASNIQVARVIRNTDATRQPQDSAGTTTETAPPVAESKTAEPPVQPVAEEAALDVQELPPTTTTASVTTPPVASITINTIAGDDVISASEAGQTNTTVSGTVGGDVKLGDTVTLTVNGHTYTTTVVDTGGGVLGYSKAVLTADLLADNSIDASVTTTDAAGNSATATAAHTVSEDTTLPVASITINTIAGDDVISASEAGQTNTTVSGTVGGDVKLGDTVTLTVNGHTYTTTVVDTGGGVLGYSKAVLTADLLADNSIDASVTTTDAAGNSATATAAHTVSEDTTLPVASITINTIAGDDVISASEAGQTNTTVSGTVGGDVKLGDTVTLTVNGHTYTTTVVDTGGGVLGYSKAVLTADLLADNSIDASVTTTDAAGNSATATAAHTVSEDTTLPVASITINTIAGDDVISASEAGQTNTTVSGTVGGDVKLGDTVTLTVNGHTYTTTVVDTGGGVLGYSKAVLTADLLADNSIDASVTTTDAAGNSATATAAHTVSEDTTLPVASITINTIAGDDVISASEAGQTNTTVSGTVGGDVKLGDTVTLTVNGHTYTTTVVDTGGGVLGYSKAVLTADLLADNSIDASVTTTDAAGNSATATAAHTVSEDTTLPVASITINTIAGDDVISASEAGQTNTTVSGTVGGDVKLGDTVTLTVNGHTYTTTVVDTGGGVLGYSKAVLTADLLADNSIDASVTTTDAAGNSATATAAHTVSEDTTLPVASITINTIAGDDVISASEAGQTNTTVSGTVGGDVKLGDTVTLTVNGHTYTTTVVDTGGGVLGYSKAVLTADLLADNSIDASVTTTDAAGNSATATAAHTVSEDTTLPVASITINTIAGDDVISASEAGQTNTTVSGTVGGDVKLGDTVTLTVNGHTYTTTVVDTGGGVLGYSKAVLTADLLADNSIDASVTTTDAAGNSATATAAHTVSEDTTLPVASITINTIAGDDVISASEAGQTNTTVSGTVGGDVKLGDTVTLTVNGHTYTTTVVDTGGGVLGYSKAVLTADLLADNSIDASVTTTDAAGNSATATAAHTVSEDTTLPVASITINTIAGDDVISASEAGQTNTTVSGTVGGDVKLGDTVTLTVNGHTYTTTVVDTGGGVLGYSKAVLTADLLADNSIDASVTTTDAAGNSATATAAHTVSEDTVRPTIAVDIAATSLKAGETSQVTFTLSEASSDFTLADVVVSGGTLSNWTTVSDTSYTATFTPDANSTVQGSVSVASDKFSDAAGNLNKDGSDPNNADTVTIDTVIRDNPVTISGLGVTGGDVLVYEDDLALGTDSSKESTTQSGTFTVTALDGASSIKVAGVEILSNGAFAGSKAITTGLGNTLTITDYNSTTGIVSYQYTLNANKTHTGSNGSLLTETFSVSVVDADGDTAAATLVAGIVDDAPVKLADAQDTILSPFSSVSGVLADLGIKVGADLSGAAVQITSTSGGSLVGQKVTDTSEYVLKANGIELVYQAYGTGGLQAVWTDAGGVTNVAFRVLPVIASDGKVSYQTTMVGEVDPKVSNTFQLSTLKNASFDPTKAVNTWLELTDTTGSVTLRFEGYKDAAGSGNSVSYDNNISTLTSTQKSQQGIGVENNFIGNTAAAVGTQNYDGAGEKLDLVFSTAVSAVGLKLDQLDTGEVAFWKAYNGTTLVGSGEFLGAGQGGSNAADQLYIANPGSTFNRLSLSAAGGSEYSILTSDVIVVLDNTPLGLSFGAQVTDGDGDKISSSSFEVILDGLLKSDITITGDADSDVLFGSDAGNVLVGGGSADALTGGLGADEFKYTALSDLTNSSSSLFEKIVDFSSADGDKVNFTTLLSGATLTNTIAIDSTDGATSHSFVKIGDYVLDINNANSGAGVSGGTYVELDSQKILGDANSTTKGNWTDVIDIKSATGFLGDTGSSTINGDGWTVKVMDVGVSHTEAGNTMTFMKNGVAVTDVHVQITTSDGVVHDVNNVDKINWHG